MLWRASPSGFLGVVSYKCISHKCGSHKKISHNRLYASTLLHSFFCTMQVFRRYFDV
jgi:hypothetical protein